MSFSTALIVMVFGFFIVAVIVHSVFVVLIEMMLAPRYNMQTDSITIFGYTFIKNRNTGEFKFCKGKLSPIISCNTVADISKIHTEYFIENNRKMMKMQALWEILVCVMICVPGILSVVFLSNDNKIGYGKLFFYSIFAGIIFHTISGLIIKLIVMHKMKHGLAGEIERLRWMLIAGIPYDEFHMRRLEELPYKNSMFIEKLMYLHYYVCEQLALGNMEEVGKTTKRMNDILAMKEEFMTQYTGFYYWLVTYYSGFEVNEFYAKQCMRKIEGIVKKDEDANAKRVLAYYHYGILKDYHKARMYLDEGLKRVEHFSRYAEQDQERTLLMRLSDMLKLME